MAMLEKKSSVSKRLQNHEDFGWLSNVALHLKNQKGKWKHIARSMIPSAYIS